MLIVNDKICLIISLGGGKLQWLFTWPKTCHFLIIMRSTDIVLGGLDTLPLIWASNDACNFASTEHWSPNLVTFANFYLETICYDTSVVKGLNVSTATIFSCFIHVFKNFNFAIIFSFFSYFYPSLSVFNILRQFWGFSNVLYQS